MKVKPDYKKEVLSDNEEDTNFSKSETNVVNQINDLNNLKKQGIISEEEFKKAKEKILN